MFAHFAPKTRDGGTFNIGRVGDYEIEVFIEPFIPMALSDRGAQRQIIPFGVFPGDSAGFRRHINADPSCISTFGKKRK